MVTIAGTDSIIKGEHVKRTKPPTADSSRIHRGFTIAASGSPSIPSRYLTIVSNNGEKRGFQQTAKRFQYDENGTPGPGQYDTSQSLDRQLEKPSDSKKGTGTFASKSKRDGFIDGLSVVPSPATYNIAPIFGHEHQDFSRGKFSSMFQKPIAEQPLSPKSIFPAPNQYDIDQGLKKITKSNNVSAQAAFRSHTKRSLGPSKSFVTPAPGSYNIDDTVTRALPPVHQSSFKSTSKRETFSVMSVNELPGPADYHPFEKVTEEPHRQVLPRRHYLAISAPAIPPPPEAPLPGPGAYNVRDFRDAEKKYMSSAAFVSNTSRWNANLLLNGERPGPGSYTPRSPTKQSFNFNFERKWLS